MKVSDVTLSDIKDYCGISGNDSDTTLNVCLSAATAYIKGYTTLTDDEIDTHEDITIALFCLINDMFSNRDYAADKAGENRTVKMILGMHCKDMI